MSFHCPLSSGKHSIQITEVKDVLKQIYVQVKNLLQNVTQSLRNIGINYNAMQYYKSVIRVITPFQLLSQFHVVDNQSLFVIKQTFPSLDFLSNTTPISLSTLKKENTAEQMLNQVSYPRHSKLRWPQTQIKNQKLHENQQNFRRGEKKNDVNHSHAQKKYNTNLNKVDFQMQQIVYDWVRSLIQKGQRTQMVDICRYARSVSKNEAFQASSGWCANFLNRHPDIKDFVKRRSQPSLYSERNKYLASTSTNQKLQGRSIYPQQSYNYSKSSYLNNNLSKKINNTRKNSDDYERLNKKMKSSVYEQQQQQEEEQIKQKIEEDHELSYSQQRQDQNQNKISSSKS